MMTPVHADDNYLVKTDKPKSYTTQCIVLPHYFTLSLLGKGRQIARARNRSNFMRYTRSADDVCETQGRRLQDEESSRVEGQTCSSRSRG